MSNPKIEEAISEVTDQWMAIDGISGVGQGKIGDKDCIEVLVTTKTRKIEDAIPSEFKGFPVRVREVGDISIQEQP
jgi:hypothetical protein